MTKLVVTGVDIETTGFDAHKGDRITEVAMLVMELNTDTMALTEKARLSTLVNPQRDIPMVVQQLTHITPALVKDQPVWSEVAPKVSRIMCLTDIFIAHNADFDAPFLAHELARLDLPFNERMEVFCSMENGRFATPLGKPPRLHELCWALDVKFNPEDAHRAIYDTEKMMEAIRVGLDKEYFTLDSTVEKVLKSKGKEAA